MVWLIINFLFTDFHRLHQKVSICWSCCQKSLTIYRYVVLRIHSTFTFIHFNSHSDIYVLYALTHWPLNPSTMNTFHSYYTDLRWYWNTQWTPALLAVFRTLQWASDQWRSPAHFHRFALSDPFVCRLLGRCAESVAPKSVIAFPHGSHSTHGMLLRPYSRRQEFARVVARCLGPLTIPLYSILPTLSLQGIHEAS